MTYTIYFDLETGGLKPEHPIIQVAAIAVDESFVELASFETKVQFDESKADADALRVNHYTKDAWKDACQPFYVASKLSDWSKPFASIEKISQSGNPYRIAKLSGYNAVTFDGPRLKSLYNGAFFPFSYQIRDVLQRVLFYFDETGATPPVDFKLVTVAAYFGLNVDGAHDALVDVRMAAGIAKVLKETL